jgi:hypothetical protein
VDSHWLNLKGLASEPRTVADEPLMPMNRKLWAEEHRLREARDRSALLALLLWGVGAYLLYLGWRAAEALPLPWGNITVFGIYLVTFFYIFAFWPILVAVEKSFRRPTPTPGCARHHDDDRVIHHPGSPAGRGAQDGGNAIQAGISSIASSREAAGGTSSPGAGR